MMESEVRQLPSYSFTVFGESYKNATGYTCIEE